MDQPIVSIDTIRAKARKAYEEGKQLEDCPMPAGSLAAKTWRNEYLVCMAERNFVAQAA